MTTWKRGREVLGERIRAQVVPIEDFLELMHTERPERVPGTAVFMTSNLGAAPPALMSNFLHNRVVHEQIVLLTIVVTERAREPEEHRIEIDDLPLGFNRVVARYGFMEEPDVPQLLVQHGLISFSLEHTSYFLGRETVLADGREGMARWREHLFSFMSRNAQGATTFFKIPPDRVFEIGSQIAI